MKPSRYNMLIASPALGPDVIVYNTLSGAIYVADPNVAVDLQRPAVNPSAMPGSILDAFIQDRVVVPDDCDELSIVRGEQARLKYRPTRAAFMVVVTYGCNLACPYCYESTKQGRMTPSVAESALKFMRAQVEKYHCTDVDLEIFGGEPLLCPEVAGYLIREMESWAQARQIRCSTILYTNGTLFDERVSAAVGHLNYRYTQVSIDGASFDHDRTRRHHDGSGSYSKIMANLPRMLEAGMRPVLRINVHKANAAHATALLDDLVSRGLHLTLPIAFGVIRHMTHACSSYGDTLGADEVEALLPALWNAAIDRGFQMSLKPKRAFVYCSSFLDSSYVIGTGGDLYKCSGLVGVPEHRVGQIASDGGVTAFTDVARQWLERDPSSDPICEQCVSLPICGGGCAATTTTASGHYHSFDCFDRARDVVAQRILLHLKSRDPERFGHLTTEFRFLNFSGQAPRPAVRRSTDAEPIIPTKHSSLKTIPLLQPMRGSCSC